MDERIRGLIFKLKIFVWYIITEPFRMFAEVIKNLNRVFIALNKTMSWAYIFFTLTAINIYEHDRFESIIFLTLLTICVLLWIWQSGQHISEYKKKEKKRISKKIKEEFEYEF